MFDWITGHGISLLPPAKKTLPANPLPSGCTGAFLRNFGSTHDCWIAAGMEWVVTGIHCPGWVLEYTECAVWGCTIPQLARVSWLQSTWLLDQEPTDTGVTAVVREADVWQIWEDIDWNAETKSWLWVLCLSVWASVWAWWEPDEVLLSPSFSVTHGFLWNKESYIACCYDVTDCRLQRKSSFIFSHQHVFTLSIIRTPR